MWSQIQVAGILLVLLLAACSVEGRNVREGSSGKRVMSWWCLERCGGTDETIAVTKNQISNNTDILTAVSFEKYNLGAHGAVVRNNLTDVGPWLQEQGLETWPMISSYPYPPQFIFYMREVFASPQPFIDQLLALGAANGYTGFNIDWEPTYGGNAQDGEDYAAFLTTVADALHEEGLGVSVDFSSWSPVWNLTLLADTSVDYLCDMATYTNDDESFLSHLQDAVATVPLEMLGVGLMDTNAETGAPMPPSAIEYRLQTAAAYDVQQIDIWMEPMLPFWFPMLRTWLDS